MVTNLGATAGALASQDQALSASVPALRDTLRASRPALVALDGTLPPLRALATEATPSVAVWTRCWTPRCPSPAS